MAKYRHDVGEESPSLRHMEPEHLGLPPRGAFPSRSGNRAALRLHLSQLGFGRDRPGQHAGMYAIRSRAELGRDSLWSFGSLVAHGPNGALRTVRPLR
jgi:hypothetical protein